MTTITNALGKRVRALRRAADITLAELSQQSGVALATWNDKTKSIISYTTNSAGAEVVLQGTVVPSYKVGRTTYRSTRYQGAGAVANLAFEADPQQCAGAGVTSAPMDGVTGIGSQ